MDSEDECIGMIIPLEKIRENDINITYGNCSNQYICNVRKYHSNKNYESGITESLLLEKKKICEITKSESKISKHTDSYSEHLANLKKCQKNKEFIFFINSRKVESLNYFNNLKSIYNSNIQDFNNSIETFNYDIPNTINESNMRSTCIDSTSTSSSNNTSDLGIEIGICNSTQRLKIYIVDNLTNHTNSPTPPLSNSPIGLASISIKDNNKPYNGYFINKPAVVNLTIDLTINIDKGNQNSSLKLYRNPINTNIIKECKLKIYQSEIQWNLMNETCFTITTDKLGENINHTLTITFN